MTEDENGRIRAQDELILKKMHVEEFFMKLLVFKERMDIKIDQLNKVKK